MYSNFLKLLLPLTGFSPVLLIFWLINTLQKRDQLSFHISIDSAEKIRLGITEIIKNHWQLLLFALIVLLSNFLMKKAVNSLTPWSIQIKSIKPADVNFTSVLISYILPWAKFLIHSDADVIYLLGFLILCFVQAYISKDSYHYNLNYRLFLGYKHYEVQTREEVTHLMLSKKKLINRDEIKRYVLLSDHMIVNVS
ncbi:MAG: hypothetical protein IAE95_11440 [Chitinophagaceae bacterium]|nr:hypothetical protein [Chitinophagaceae bacterium]